MHRVVVDSDDEEGEEVNNSPKQTTAQAASFASSADAGQISATADHPSGTLPSTTSTERLWTEMQKAHNALVEPTPSGKRRAVDDLDLLPSLSPNRWVPASRKRIRSLDLRRSNQELERDHSQHKSSSAHGASQQDDPWAVPSSPASPSSATTLKSLGKSVPMETAMSDVDTIQQSAPTMTSRVPKTALLESIHEETHESTDPPKIVTQEQFKDTSPELSQVSQCLTKSRRSSPGLEPPGMGKVRKLLDKQEERSSDVLNSDDITAIGLPKEQYKPRPSRSRSVRVVIEREEIPPFRAERKKRTRRSKTTDGNGLAEQSLLVDMGFSNSQAAKAIQESEGNVERAIESLLIPKEAGEEAAKNDEADTIMLEDPDENVVKIRKGRGTHTQASSKVERGIASLDQVPQQSHSLNQEAFEIEPEADPVHRVAAPEEKEKKATKLVAGRGRPKKTPVLILKDDVEESKNEEDLDVEKPEAVESVTQEVEEKPAQPKKTRGRPKKTLKSAEEVAPIVDVPDHAKVEKQEEADVPAPSETSQPLVPPSLGATENQADAAALQPDLVPAKAQTPDRIPRPGTKLHSPISKGKVPHKLGLSRRARVEPLLRKIKK